MDKYKKHTQEVMDQGAKQIKKIRRRLAKLC